MANLIPIHEEFSVFCDPSQIIPLVANKKDDLSILLNKDVLITPDKNSFITKEFKANYEVKAQINYFGLGGFNLAQL